MNYATLFDLITDDDTPTWVRGLITLLKVDIEKTPVRTDIDYAAIYPCYIDEVDLGYKNYMKFIFDNIENASKTSMEIQTTYEYGHEKIPFTFKRRDDFSDKRIEISIPKVYGFDFQGNENITKKEAWVALCKARGTHIEVKI